MRSPAVRSLIATIAALLVLAAVACTAEESTRPAPTAAPLYVAIGASDSVGTGARNPASEGWVPQLHQKMPPGTRLANLGIGGLQIHQAIDQVLPVAADLRPSIVTVWLAVNDFAAGVPLEAYRADLDTLLGALSQATQARIYVANLPDLSLLPAFRNHPPAELQAEVRRWNEVIAAAAAAHGAVLIDLFAGWSELRDHPEYISRDGLHPSSRGYRRLAEIFWEAISNGQ